MFYPMFYLLINFHPLSPRGAYMLLPPLVQLSL